MSEVIVRLKDRHIKVKGGEYVQEIVRCSECKYCVDAGAQRALVCDNSYIDMDIHPDDFCSYGCRDSEKPNNSERSSE